MNATRDELSWAAGLFEGEGCLSSSISNKRYQLRTFRARLNMVDKDVVARFATILGFGALRILPQKNPKHQTQWVWYATRYEHFQALIAILWPWFGERRRTKAKELLLLARGYHSTRQPRFGWGILHTRAIATGRKAAKCR
jgi:hypothetical protein